MSELSSFLVAKPYIRVFVKAADGPNFVRKYLRTFGARIEYYFRIPRLKNLEVIGIESGLGNVSVVVTDSLDGFPEYIARTRVLYRTEDMEAALSAADADGMRVLQDKTPVPIGYQGRFEMPGGYVVELFEVSSQGEQYFHPDPVQLGFA